MKLIRKVGVLACSASLFLVSCGDGSSQNTLYFNNYTHADTEGYAFLKTVMTEAHFQQFASGGIGNAALASEIKSTYAQIGQELHALGDQQHVLSPSLLDLQHAADSVTIDQLVHSQEVIVGQFERVLQNTNTHIANYARETLPKLEQLLDQTKAVK